MLKTCGAERGTMKNWRRRLMVEGELTYWRMWCSSGE